MSGRTRIRRLSPLRIWAMSMQIRTRRPLMLAHHVIQCSIHYLVRPAPKPNSIAARDSAATTARLEGPPGDQQGPRKLEAAVNFATECMTERCQKLDEEKNIQCRELERLLPFEEASDKLTPMSGQWEHDEDYYVAQIKTMRNQLLVSINRETRVFRLE